MLASMQGDELVKKFILQLGISEKLGTIVITAEEFFTLPIELLQQILASLSENPSIVTYSLDISTWGKVNQENLVNGIAGLLKISFLAEFNLKGDLTWLDENNLLKLAEAVASSPSLKAGNFIETNLHKLGHNLVVKFIHKCYEHKNNFLVDFFPYNTHFDFGTVAIEPEYYANTAALEILPRYLSSDEKTLNPKEGILVCLANNYFDFLYSYVKKHSIINQKFDRIIEKLYVFDLLTNEQLVELLAGRLAVFIAEQCTEALVLDAYSQAFAIKDKYSGVCAEFAKYVVTKMDENGSYSLVYAAITKFAEPIFTYEDGQKIAQVLLRTLTNEEVLTSSSVLPSELNEQKLISFIGAQHEDIDRAVNFLWNYDMLSSQGTYAVLQLRLAQYLQEGQIDFACYPWQSFSKVQVTKLASNLTKGMFDRVLSSIVNLDEDYRFEFLKAYMKRTYSHDQTFIEIMNLGEVNRLDLAIFIGRKGDLFTYETWLQTLDFNERLKCFIDIWSNDHCCIFNTYNGKTAAKILNLADNGILKMLDEYICFVDEVDSVEEAIGLVGTGLEQLDVICRDKTHVINSENHMLSTCLQKIKSTLSSEENMDVYRLIKCKNMLEWCYFMAVRLLEEDTDKNSVKNREEVLSKAKVNLARLLQEVLTLQDPSLRFALSTPIVNVIHLANVREVFSKLLQSRNEEAINKRAYLPVLILANIICEQSATPTTEDIDTAKNIVRAIPAEYKEGSNLRILISGMLSIYNAKALNKHEKINLLKLLFVYEVEYKIFGQADDLQQVQEQWLLASKGKLNKLLIMVSADENKYMLTGVDRNGKLLKGHDLVQDENFKELVQALGKTPKNLRKLRKSFDISAAVKRSRTLPVGFSFQVQALMLIKGLQSCDLLTALKPKTLARTQSIFSGYAEGIKKCFALNDEQMQLFTVQFANCHNSTALLAYYSSLSKLEGSERDKYLGLLQEYVHVVASPQAEQYYKLRYDTDRNVHLQTMIATSSEIKHNWMQGKKVDYKEFMQGRVIKSESEGINIPTFFNRVVKDHKHLPESLFPNLHDLLLGNVSETIQVSSNESLNSKQQDFAKVEKLSIQLLQNLDSFSYKEKMSVLKELKTLCERNEETKTFARDVITLYEALLKLNTSNHAVSDTKDRTGWQIIDTDHYWTMLMLGTDVGDSCQRVDGDPHYNKCLIGGYVLSGHVRAIVILDKDKKVIARSVLRLMWDSTAQVPVLFLEEVYPQFVHAQYHAAIEEFACERAKVLGLSLVKIQGTNEVKDNYPNELSVLAVNGSEYVDALDGPQTEAYTISAEQLMVLFKVELRYVHDKRCVPA